MSENMETGENEEQPDTDDNPVIINSQSSSDSTDINESDSQSTVLATLSQNSVSSSVNDENSQPCKSPPKKRRSSEALQKEEDDSQMCPICLDIWTTSGDHRLCSLKCGHLFGYNCIKRWLNSEIRRCCPTCKKKVHFNDIRYIYARKVIAMDTVELTIAKQKMEEAVKEKNIMQIELSKAICRMHTLNQEVEEYKNKLTAMMYTRKQGEMGHSSTQRSTEILHLYKEKTIELGKNSGCRVFDCKTRLDTIAVSTKSLNNLYSGFGIKTISIANYKSTAFIPLHAQMIRDIKFHETEPWLLSCSVDKKTKILDINTNNIISTFESESPLWSCSWDIDNDYFFYVGQQQGSVLKFDIRQPSEPIYTISVPGDFSPVVSVQALRSSCTLFPYGGVISCKLNSIWVFEPKEGGPLCYPLPLEGPFISMTYQKDNDHLFLSSRPNSRCPYARHFLCGFHKEDTAVRCEIVHTFRGGSTQKMLTRTCLLSYKNNYAAAYIEDQRIISLWNINTGNKVGSVPAHESVLDLNCIKTSYGDFLLSLTESKLEFFKFAN